MTIHFFPKCLCLFLESKPWVVRLTGCFIIPNNSRVVQMSLSCLCHSFPSVTDVWTSVTQVWASRHKKNERYPQLCFVPLLCFVPCWQHYCYKFKNHFKIWNGFSWIFWYFFIKACRIIFEMWSCSSPDQSGWESYDFLNLNCPKPLESGHVFCLGRSVLLNDISKFFKHFSQNSHEIPFPERYYLRFFDTKWARGDFSKFDTPCHSYALPAAQSVRTWKFIPLESDFLGYWKYF